MTTKKTVSVILVLAFMIGAMVFASPYWALYQIKTAYDAQDATALNRYINFAQVQTDLKSQLTPILIAKAETITNSPLLKMLNIQIDAKHAVTDMVTQAVDNTVTPTGVSTLLAGQTSLNQLDNNAKLLGGLLAVAMDKVDIQDLITARNQDELTAKVKEQLTRPNPKAVTVKDSAKYCGFNCFAVQTQVQGYPIKVEMARQGLLTWQIVKVKLPL